ncbi:hypothetical protein N9219_04855 [bacterium]|nr:hypothetical protein [bacterium]
MAKTKYQPSTDKLRNAQISISQKKFQIWDGYQNRGLLAMTYNIPTLH